MAFLPILLKEARVYPGSDILAATEATPWYWSQFRTMTFLFGLLLGKDIDLTIIWHSEVLGGVTDLNLMAVV